MVTIIKAMTIGIRPQHSKELDKLLNDLGVRPINTRFFLKRRILWDIDYVDIMPKFYVTSTRKKNCYIV